MLLNSFAPIFPHLMTEYQKRNTNTTQYICRLYRIPPKNNLKGIDAQKDNGTDKTPNKNAFTNCPVGSGDLLSL